MKMSNLSGVNSSKDVDVVKMREDRKILEKSLNLSDQNPQNPLGPSNRDNYYMEYRFQVN